MDTEKMIANDCVNIIEEPASRSENIKMLEISQAIQELDSKLTDLEHHLNLNQKRD